MSFHSAVRTRNSWRSLALCAVGTFVCGSTLQAQDTGDSPTQPVTASEHAPERFEPFVSVLQVGAGLTRRRIELPTWQGPKTLDSGLAAALDLRVSARITDQRHFIRVRITYQTSLDAEAGDRVRAVSAEPTTTAIRSHRFEGGVAPGLWMGDGPGSVALGLFIGYGVRAFGSVTELSMPRFTLHGPVLRLELEIPLAHSWSLRLAPEANLMISMSEALRRVGVLERWGMAFGAEASLQLELFSPLSVRLSYRESHAFAASGTAPDAQLIDVERYVVLAGLIRY
jgi:hypothetical protein